MLDVDVIRYLGNSVKNGIHLACAVFSDLSSIPLFVGHRSWLQEQILMKHNADIL